jgi:hypothetical protein
MGLHSYQVRDIDGVVLGDNIKDVHIDPLVT